MASIACGGLALKFIFYQRRFDKSVIELSLDRQFSKKSI
jgi:hypothetical protein